MLFTIRNYLKRLLTGLSVQQEYVCSSFEDFENPLSVILSLDDGVDFAIDVTSTHIFLGYKPLIIGLPFSVNSRELEILEKHDTIRLDFVIKSLQDSGVANGSGLKVKKVAYLHLKKCNRRVIGNWVILFHEGIYGKHFFINPINQWINNIRASLQKPKLGNVNLPGNLYDQVRIAYSMPRIISLITVVDGMRMNMFPTDLHGAVNDTIYVGSLRIGGFANQQVEKSKQIVLSEVDVSRFNYVYSLGKNHMKAMSEPHNFFLHQDRSLKFQIPLPHGVIKYRELVCSDSVDIGIHRLHLYSVVNRQPCNSGSTLCHIHQYYAQWREDNDVTTKYFFR